MIWNHSNRFKKNENPFILKINNVTGYFYSSGIEKVETIFLKSKWVDYSTNDVYQLNSKEQQGLISKFVSFTFEQNPYFKIKNLEKDIYQLEEQINILKI
ncbi:hypothetical protein [Spiroplasma endosymbiont of Virgichneumon dumeticola]|uniref:hypothetical protein n=1 Tax=Spiroplasma endosymbiont of Virgichneumon dumeticola TaxID=3139323 RepID=UPI0035C8F32C